MTPAVTVLLPVYNAMPFLPAAVESILAQTYSDFRLLIIDDGSTDVGPAFLRELSDARIRVIRRTNHGLGDTLNHGIAACETELLARMDADDVAHPRRIETQVAFMKAHPRVVMLGTQIAFLIGDKLQRAIPAPLDHGGIEKRLLAGRAGVCHPTIMVRTAVAQEIGGYRIRGAGEDVDFFLRMSERGEVANVPGVLHQYRLHAGSLALSRREEIQRGYAFALEAARCRRAAKPEPEYNAFALMWERRTLMKRVADRVEDWSGLQYRKSRIDLAGGRRARGVARLVAAAACQPGVCLQQVPRAVASARRALFARDE